MMRASDMSGNLFSLLLPLLLLLLLLSTSCAASKADDGKQQYPAGPSATDAVQQESDCCTHRSAHHKGINWKTRQLCAPPPSRRLLKMSSSTKQLASPSNPGAYFIENGCTRVLDPGSFEGGLTTLLHWCKWSVMLRESVQSSGRETWTLVREPVQYIYIYRFCVVARAGSIQQQQQQEVVPS